MKATVKKQKRQAIDWGKYFQNLNLIKDLYLDHISNFHNRVR